MSTGCFFPFYCKQIYILLNLDKKLQFLKDYNAESNVKLNVIFLRCNQENLFFFAQYILTS